MIDQTLLTAYALGEATPAQIKAVKKAIKQDPSLKAEIQAIQEMASLVGESLQHEPLPKLTAKQRARILGQSPLWLTYAGLAAALRR